MTTQSDLTVNFRTVNFSNHGLEGAGEKARMLLEEYGCFIASGLITSEEIFAIQEEVRKLIALRLELRGKTVIDDNNKLNRFDDGLVPLSKIDRTEASYIYNACRQLMPIHALDVKPLLVNLSKYLLRSDTVMASNVKMMRIDLPGEEKFLYPWHQDYPYVQDSTDALVYWFPIHDLKGNDGGLECALGSHKNGVYPVNVNDSGNKSANRAHSISLADETVLDKFPHIFIKDFKAGDVLVFNTLLLHCSIKSESPRPRWTIQLRHGNFNNPISVLKGWPGSHSLTSSFEKTHPEYVANISEIK